MQYLDTFIVCNRSQTDGSDFVTVSKQKKGVMNIIKHCQSYYKSCQYVCSGPVIKTLNREVIMNAKDDHKHKGDHIQ